MTTKTFLSRHEWHVGLALSCVLFLRMLALFLLLPITALAARNLSGGEPLLTGIALGAYGLTQALLQIPLGTLSDHWGRKPVILLGLLVFATGCLVAAMANSIYGLIMGRALQGAGAIAAALMALAADLSQEEKRTSVMALLGTSVGLAFGLALLLGPVLYALLGFSSLLLLCAGMAAGAMLALLVLVPSTPIQTTATHLRETNAPASQQTCDYRTLGFLALGIFLSHGMLMANFTVLPLLLQDTLGIPAAMQWQFYLPMLLVSLLGTIVLWRILSKQGPSEDAIMACIIIYFCAYIGFGLAPHHYLSLFLFTSLFLSAFSYLEAHLPAEVSRIAPLYRRGTAMGIYNTAQFLGIFCGGLFGGILHEVATQRAVFLGCVIVSGVWLSLAFAHRRHRKPEP